jgi:hypothetical protein
LLFAYLPHAADADTQVIKHAFRNGHEFLAGGSDRNAPRAAIKQADAENIFDALDGSGQGGLRCFQESGCGDKAVVFSHSENGMQLAGGQIGDVGAHRFMQKMELKLIMEKY